MGAPYDVLELVASVYIQHADAGGDPDGVLATDGPDHCGPGENLLEARDARSQHRLVLANRLMLVVVGAIAELAGDAQARLISRWLRAQPRQVTLETTTRRSRNRHLICPGRLAATRADRVALINANGVVLSQQHGVKSVAGHPRVHHGG